MCGWYDEDISKIGQQVPESDRRISVKGKQVENLRDLVTVSREHRIMRMSKRHDGHWFLETGKVI